MNMATNPTELIEAASRDAEDLVAWAEPNWVALNDERMDAAVRRGLSGPVPDDLAFGVPLLRFADTAIPAIPLIEALIGDVRHQPTHCDRCGDDRRSVLDRLLVPSGASVVVVHVCWRCYISLEMSYKGGSTLVWD